MACNYKKINSDYEYENVDLKDLSKFGNRSVNGLVKKELVFKKRKRRYK